MWTQKKRACARRCVLLAAAAAAIGGFHQIKAADAQITAADPATVIAKAGSVEITAADLRETISLLPGATRASLHANTGLLQGLVRSEITEKALLAEARAHGFDSEPRTREHVDQAARKALANLWIAEQGTPPASYPDAAQIEAAYEAGRKHPPIEYHLADIFVRAPDGTDPAKLAAALRKIAHIEAQLPTADFAQLARADSDDPETAAKGGDAGFTAADRLIDDIADAVKGLKPGEVAGPIKSAGGFHFLKLIATRTPDPPTLDSVRQSLIAQLRDRERKSLETLYMRELSDRLNIRIDSAALGRLQAGL